MDNKRGGRTIARAEQKKLKMFGTLSHELEVNVPASEAWKLYGTLELAKLVEKELSIIDRIELVEGDGGVGTILNLVFKSGAPGYPGYKEKFTKIQEDKYLKETEVVEGGFLELGFTLYRVRFQIIEKGSDSCCICSTIEYEVKDEASDNASVVSIQPIAGVAEISKNYLLTKEV